MMVGGGQLARLVEIRLPNGVYHDEDCLAHITEVLVHGDTGNAAGTEEHQYLSLKVVSHCVLRFDSFEEERIECVMESRLVNYPQQPTRNNFTYSKHAHVHTYIQQKDMRIYIYIFLGLDVAK